MAAIISNYHACAAPDSFSPSLHYVTSVLSSAPSGSSNRIENEVLLGYCQVRCRGYRNSERSSISDPLKPSFVVACAQQCLYKVHQSATRSFVLCRLPKEHLSSKQGGWKNRGEDPSVASRNGAVGCCSYNLATRIYDKHRHWSWTARCQKAGSESPIDSSFVDRMRSNPLRGLFEGLSEGVPSNGINKLENDNFEREIAVMALPSLVAQAADPVAQLLETAYIGTIDELGLEIAVIALPAMLALAADPLASLVDTAFIGQIGIGSCVGHTSGIVSQQGPVELAAVGVSISVFNLVSKMFNLPLLNVTTSFVAEDDASAKDAQLESSSMDHVQLDTEETISAASSKKVLPAVSSALVLGTGLGIMEAAVLAFGANPILTAMGVGVDSPMRVPAVQYLALRAIGAPAVVVSLAIQGVFRGFKDTKTPLVATVLGNVVNIVLDPILMFSLKFGVGGAAVATVFSQYVIVLLLLWNLNLRVVLLPPKLSDLHFDRFLKSGGLLLGRTLAILFTMTLATSMAARQGPISMAAHQICMQIWLAASLLSDSLALAGQAIIASAFAKQDYKRVRQVAFRILQLGLGCGLVMAMILGGGASWFTKLFTKDAGVLESIALILPFVVLTQPINSLAFVFDGIHYGASDFSYAAYSMVVLAFPSSLVLIILSPLWGLPAVWVGLTVVMVLRMAAGFLRLGTASGPWRFLSRDLEGRLLTHDVDENMTQL